MVDGNLAFRNGVTCHRAGHLISRNPYRDHGRSWYDFIAGFKWSDEGYMSAHTTTPSAAYPFLPPLTKN